MGQLSQESRVFAIAQDDDRLKPWVDGDSIDRDKLQDGLIARVAIPSLHYRTCVGSWTYPMYKIDATMPDGRIVEFEGAEDGDAFKVSRVGNETTIEDGPTACTEVSADWKRMVRVLDGRIGLYDFEGVLRSGTLVGNEIGELPIKDASSATFFDKIGDRIVTTNSSNQVLLWEADAKHKLWRSEQIYDSDYDVFYAESDLLGKKLIILEDHGPNEMRGWLYSLDAHELWLDLGEGGGGPIV